MMSPSGKDVAAPVSVTVGPSPLKLLVALLIACLWGAFAAALFVLVLALKRWQLHIPQDLRWTNVGTAAALTACGVGALIMLIWLTQKPRVEIGPDGFVSRTLFRTRTRRWCDVDGDFAVVRIGFLRAVAYRLTPDVKKTVGAKPSPLLQGYDEDITGAYAVSLRELARLLNEQKRLSHSQA